MGGWKDRRTDGRDSILLPIGGQYDLTWGDYSRWATINRKLCKTQIVPTLSFFVRLSVQNCVRKVQHLTFLDKSCHINNQQWTD